VQDAIDQQNAVTPTAFFETKTDRVQIRVDGAFKSLDEIRNFPIRVGDRSLRLSDVAEVKRGFTDPAQPRVRFMGEDSIGIAVSMKKGGDIIALGKHLDEEFARLKDSLPVGMQLRKITDQSDAVSSSIGEFVWALAEAVAIVLAVSFFFLGRRAGAVVALSIPLVLAMTFAAMDYFGIGLHKISLGALIVALGLLVDDAIIAVEMMAVKMEQGFDRMKAASFAYTSTAFPMLTGTLVTAAGFIPIATAQSGTGEYTRSIAQVVTLALLLSWVAAVIFIPYLGAKILPDPKPLDHGQTHHEVYDTAFYRRFRRWVAWCVAHNKTVIVATVLATVMSLVMFKYVPQQFFPSSMRLELVIDLELAEGASLEATEAVAKRFEALIKNRSEVDSVVGYVGTGSPRFYLPLDQKLPQANFSQYVITAKDIEAREALRTWLIEKFKTDFSDIQARITRLENGPPVGYPIQFRVSGEHIDEVRAIAQRVADKVRENSNVDNVHLDWDEPSKIVKIHIDQERARALGVTSAQVALFLRGSLSGTHISTFRQGNELIEISLRGPAQERESLAMLGSLAVPTTNGRAVTLSQIGKLEYGFEEGIIWHRNRLPTVIVRADVYKNITPPEVTKQLLPTLEAIRASLPNGYLLETGGTVEDSGKGAKSVAAGVPLFLLVVITLLMIQLKSFARTAMVLLTAPPGLIGVTLFLLVFRVPFGFVAMLGTIALSGMIMRNSVILLDQIDQDIESGHTPTEAVIDATVRRFRPIVLTALAAILAMIPLSRSVFFGPMATAIMGGLLVATVLTLLFLPALYAAWFKVPKPDMKRYA
jgi:multidrug efflux pump